MLYRNTQLAEVKFPILPLDTYNGSPAKVHQLTYLNRGSKEKKDLKNSLFDKFLPSTEQKQHLRATSDLNTQKTGDELAAWIDQLFAMFYKIAQTCGTICGVQLDSCEQTHWSSLAPDPKSAIGTSKGTTGSFDVW